MSYLYKEYQPSKVEGTQIKFAISFNKETRSWATGEPKKIGYQCTVIPVRRTKPDPNSIVIIEESTAFSGFNVNLLEIDRQSKKRLETAINILQERKQEFIDNINNRL